MRKQRGNIYLYIALLGATWWWVPMGDEYFTLSQVLKSYQQDNGDNQAEAQLAIALTRVVEKRVKPSLVKKLKPQDIDDVCSEVVLGFWKFRHSVRSDETGKLINTLVQRKLNDHLRGYYKEAEHIASEKSEDEIGLLAMLPGRNLGIDGEAEQDTWDLINSLELSARDHLVAYMVCEGIEKQVVSEMLGINPATIARSLSRCRQALVGQQGSDKMKEGHA